MRFTLSEFRIATLPHRIRGLSPKPAAVAAACALALVATGGTVRAATAGEVAIKVDGQTITVNARTVDDAREAVQAAGVELGEHDVVTPLGEAHKGDTISVERAYPFMLKLNGEIRAEWSVKPTVGEALQALLGEQMTGAAVDQVPELPLFPDQVSVTVTTRKTVSIVVSGRPRKVESNAETVEGLLKDAGVTLAGRDLVLPGPAAPVTDGMTVHVSKLAPGQKVVTSPIRFKTVRQSTDQLPVGKTRVATEGADGEMTSVYADTVQDGRVVDRRLVSQTVSVPPRSKVILVGTRTQRATARASGNSGSYEPQGDTVWDRLAQCESGGNWQINTGNGYYGGIQFDLQTWRANGGTGYPHEHTRSEQIAVAQRLHAKRGFAPWPACSRKLGLL